MQATVNKSSRYMGRLHDTIGSVLGGNPEDYSIVGNANDAETLYV